MSNTPEYNKITTKNDGLLSTLSALIIILTWLFLFGVVPYSVVWAEKYPIISPMAFSRHPGMPKAETITFKVKRVAAEHELCVFNGGSEQLRIVGKSIQAAEIQLNHQNIFNPKVFQSDQSVFCKSVTLQAQNKLNVKILGNVKGLIVITVLEQDTIKPSIKAKLSGVANQHGWYAKPVMVAFYCQDKESGIASCPEVAEMRREGEAQPISGIAEDIAGNTNTVTMKANVDLTQPMLHIIKPSAGDTLDISMPNIVLQATDLLSINQDSLIIRMNNKPLQHSCHLTWQDSSAVLFNCLPKVKLQSGKYNLTAMVSDLAGHIAVVHSHFWVQLDLDLDEVMVAHDLCPNTAKGVTVDTEGCAQNQKDSDADGVMDSIDRCEATPQDEPVVTQFNKSQPVDIRGCALTQLDTDSDGVSDALDLCADTSSKKTVDAEGCAAGQSDDDGDGINNFIDRCPKTFLGESVNHLGCSE